MNRKEYTIVGDEKMPRRRNARDQIRRGRKVAANMVGFIILVFAKSIIYDKHLDMIFFSTCHIVLGVGKL